MRLMLAPFVVIFLLVTGCQTATKKEDPPARAEKDHVNLPANGNAPTQTTPAPAGEQAHTSSVSAVAVPLHLKASKSPDTKPRHLRNSAAEERAKQIWSLTAQERLNWANSELRKRGIDVPDSEQ